MLEWRPGSSFVMAATNENAMTSWLDSFLQEVLADIELGPNPAKTSREDRRECKRAYNRASAGQYRQRVQATKRNKQAYRQTLEQRHTALQHEVAKLTQEVAMLRQRLYCL